MDNCGKIGRYIVKEDMSIQEVLKIIDNNSGGAVFCVDEQGRLKGSITDGDIRRWIIRTGDTSANVGRVMFRNVHYFFENERDMAWSKIIDEQIQAIPIVDSKHRIIDIVMKDDRVGLQNVDKIGNALADIPVIIMAGGRGTRLYPYTKILPKPLIPVGDIPILERIIKRFRRYGARRFYVTINYKKEIIKAYMSELDFANEIVFVEEENPLGTAGSISLIEDISEDSVLISNCDILIEVDYEKVVEYHTKNECDITIIGSQKKISIPYGVIHTDEDGLVKCVEEKPQITRFVNTGMYMLKSECMKWIPHGCVYNMTDLIDTLVEKNKKVAMYPVGDISFLDMGEFEEMKRMEMRLNEVKEN